MEQYDGPIKRNEIKEHENPFSTRWVWTCFSLKFMKKKVFDIKQGELHWEINKRIKLTFTWATRRVDRWMALDTANDFRFETTQNGELRNPKNATYTRVDGRRATERIASNRPIRSTCSFFCFCNWFWPFPTRSTPWETVAPINRLSQS